MAYRLRQQHFGAPHKQLIDPRVPLIGRQSVVADKHPKLLQRDQRLLWVGLREPDLGIVDRTGISLQIRVDEAKRSGAQIGNHHVRSREVPDSLDQRAFVADLDPGAHAEELRSVQKPVFKYGFLDHGFSLC